MKAVKCGGLDSSSLGTWFVHIADNVGHTCLEGHESREMWGFGCIISWKTLDLTPSVFCSFTRQKPDRARPGFLKFTVRHGGKERTERYVTSSSIICQNCVGNCYGNVVYESPSKNF